MNKYCPHCKKDIPASLFYRNSRAKSGLDGYCIPCRKLRFKPEYNKNRETYRRYAQSEKGKLAQLRARNKPAAKRKAFSRHLMVNFGITVEQYEMIFRRQNGGCAICHEQNLNGKRLCVDHNHATGQIRGLLCDKCNYAIGRVREDWRILDSMKDYLELWGRIGEVAK